MHPDRAFGGYSDPLLRGYSDPLSPQPVAEPHELLVAGNVDELQVSCRQPAWKQRSSSTECHRRDADQNLVQ